ncbi:uncharacterized protein F5147DRAFT_726818 [Suillus discolor]|uniref:Six-hairpin glycosidase n=1 Tax=Suillus discolor TaxID=1912936 RepID=A0A9P7EUA2_9AGAM|nr:uncharacterized protein F5147DRAFT_726818 [Suillus discolor]KAG2088566.1 hypothetical protein F5147DRAFT_726818 [Suillus discolor]
MVLFFVAGLLQNLASAQISVISERLAQGAVHRWEYGARAEALLELNAPTYSVVSFNVVLPPHSIPSNITSALGEVFTIAHNIVVARSLSNITGPQPLIADTSAGDPASIGVSVLLANWTGQGALDGLDYAGAAQDQLHYLFQNVSKTKDGAFSRRVDQLQLWSDCVYMVPPFLAYYGVLTQNQTILGEAYTQIRLYRKYLRDTAASNLWKHIQLGNAWATAGMIRSQQNDLAHWVHEIHGAMYSHINSNGLFYNYADNNTTFYDASSTVTSSTALAGTGTTVSGLLHFTPEGWLTPVVNPYSYGVQGSDSPEAQAFILELQAAWRDWVADGAHGTNSAREARPHVLMIGVILPVLHWLMIVIT